MEYEKILGMKVHRNYWNWIVWLFVAAVTYFVMSANPDNPHMEQLHVKIRNLALYFLALYSVRKLELVKIPFQESILAVIKSGVKHPHYGHAIIATAVYYMGVIGGAATVIIGSS